MLTSVFVGAYFVLRALPDAQCGFLHYEEIIHPDGTVELCATNHAGFMDLTKLEYPIRTELSFSSDLVPGQQSEVTMELLTSGGMTIAPYELAQTHTKLMHVMVIDPSLEDYHHIHPQPVGINGQYTFEFTPKLSGNYRFYTEVVPMVTRRQQIAQSRVPVEGAADAPRFTRPTLESVVDGVRFALSGLPEVLQTNTDHRLELKVASADGGSLELETIMGAKGHMVAFDAEGKGFAHMHPEDSIVSARAGLSLDKPTNTMGFIFNVPNPGWYRVFAQIQVEGREVFGRFDFRVK